MNKKVIVFLYLLFTSILIGIMLYITILKDNDKNNSVDTPENVVINQYKLGKMDLIKTIEIKKDDDLNKLKVFVEKIKPLSEKEMVDLALLNEIEIKYNENIYIEIQLSKKYYCNFTNKNNNESYLAKMPEGLYEWLNEKIK